MASVSDPVEVPVFCAATVLRFTVTRAVAFAYDAVSVPAALASIQVFDADRQRVELGAPGAGDDNSIVVASMPSLDDGLYAVIWRVTSADGHVIDGAFSFQVGTASAGSGQNLIDQVRGGSGVDLTLKWVYGIARFLSLAGVIMLVGGVVLGATGIATGELPEWHWEWRGMLAIVFLAVFASAITYTAFTWLMKNARTDRVATFAYVNPAIATVLGWVVLGETLTRIAGDRLGLDIEMLPAGALPAPGPKPFFSISVVSPPVSFMIAGKVSPSPRSLPNPALASLPPWNFDRSSSNLVRPSPACSPPFILPAACDTSPTSPISVAARARSSPCVPTNRSVAPASDPFIASRSSNERIPEPFA